MSRTVRGVLVLMGVAVLGAVVAKRVGLVGGTAGSPTTALPITCRLLGHTWTSPGTASGAPTRRTCGRCEHLDLPLR